MTEHWIIPELPEGWDAARYEVFRQLCVDGEIECYIAGPMRGVPDYNYPAFNSAASLLRGAGWMVNNPAENDNDVLDEIVRLEKDDNPLKVYMRKDLQDVLRSQLVVVLPGWEHSKGACLEVHVAHETDTPVFDFVYWGRILPPQDIEPVMVAVKRGLDFGPEERATDPATGGSKGRKQAVFAHVPLYAQVMKARVHGFGIFKYPDQDGAPNWTKGTPWSWMYDACQRHILAFWSGEVLNPESGLPHLAHAAWMLDVLMEFEHKGLGTDDRPTY